MKLAVVYKALDRLYARQMNFGEAQAMPAGRTILLITANYWIALLPCFHQLTDVTVHMNIIPELRILRVRLVVDGDFSCSENSALQLALCDPDTNEVIWHCDEAGGRSDSRKLAERIGYEIAFYELWYSY